MTPCVFTDPVNVGTNSEGFAVFQVFCTRHNTVAVCSVLFYSGLDQAVIEMRNQIEAYCFEKFMKGQMGVVK